MNNALRRIAKEMPYILALAIMWVGAVVVGVIAFRFIISAELGYALVATIPFFWLLGRGEKEVTLE
jgi:hypothetical protein